MNSKAYRHGIPLIKKATMQMHQVRKGKETIICIIGMHRSGTSMVARLLNLCGLYLGSSEQLMQPNEFNPQGYFENETFVKINDALLDHFGGSWDNPPQFENDWEQNASIGKLVDEANALIETFPKLNFWGWKDPRTTILLPFWKCLIPNLRFVICLRSPLEVAKSLSYRDRMPIQKGISLWHRYTRAAIIDTEGCPRLFTFYEDYFRDLPAEMNRLVEFCKLQKPVKISLIEKAISNHLKHHTCETSDLLNETMIVFEHKVLYIALRAITYQGFVDSISADKREELISENISKFFKVLEQFHDEQEMAQLQSALVEWRSLAENLQVVLHDKELHIQNLHDHIANLEMELSKLKTFEKKVKSTPIYRIYRRLKLYKIYN